MKAATLFSGIGAPEVAMPRWDWLWHAEIEPFPTAVMKVRHQNSINLGDVTAHDFTERATAIGRPDVIVFGSPCQSFSVAGQRLGLDDPRGNLALVALGIVARLKPRWFVFENVPGLLSSDEGRDFGIFLRTVDDIGYRGGWAVLDAQYFGLAQRRERLFFVGHAGDWRRAAAVLLESEGLCGNYPPSRQAGQRVAPTVEARANAGGAGWGTDFLADGGMAVEGEELAKSIPARPWASHREDSDTLIAGAVSSKWAKQAGGPAGDECYNLVADPIQANEARTYANGGHYTRAIRTAHRATRCRHFPPTPTRAIKDPVVQVGAAVRRLTPKECLRLQGFPDDYLDITWRGKPAVDSPKYRAVGNSMAVPVVRWILERIEKMESIE